jgi:hypothetical protein
MRYFEIYKCIVLTLIALMVAGLWLHTRPPVVVRVRDGYIDVDNTVQVEGSVSIER